MAFAIAIAIAVVLGLYEQHTRLGHRFTHEHHALLWYVARAAIEAAFATVALLAAQALHVRYSHDWFAGFGAWFVGASAARSSALRPRRKGTDVQIGIEFFFDGLRGGVEARLDRIGQNAETRWRERSVPVLVRSGMTPEGFGARLKEQLQGLETIRESDRRAELKAIEQDIRDVASGNEDRLNVLLQRAQRLRLYEFLDDTLKDAKAVLPGPAGTGSAADGGG